LTEIERYSRTEQTWTDYPAFQLPRSGATIFTVDGFDNPLACLSTKTGHMLWLMKSDEPNSGIDLALNAQRVITAPRRLDNNWSAGATIPTLDFDVQPDLSWMLNFSSVTADGGGHAITQAFQQFKLRLNDKGARVKVATGFATRGGPSGPVPYTFDDPFMGFFTQPGHDELAIAAFYADVDVWKKPAGSLEEL
jgi:hypothetical protein